MKVNDIYNIIPMVQCLKNGSHLFKPEENQGKRLTKQQQDLFYMMDNMVTQMPDGKVFLTHCILLAISDQYVTEVQQIFESLKMSRKQQDLPNQKIGMNTLNMIIPSYKRLVKEYKSYMTAQNIEESTDTNQHVEYIFHDYAYNFEDDLMS